MVRPALGVLIAFIAVVCVQGLSAQSLFEQGEALLRENKPLEAAAVLRSSLQQNSGNPQTYLYLAIAYEQLGRNEEAVGILERALSVTGVPRARASFNMGNNLWAMGRAADAMDAYDQAITAAPNFAPAYLNRANASVSVEDYEQAIADYGRYLELEPNTPQKSAIERMIAALASEIEAERMRQEEEERRQREAEEQRRREEEERRLAEERRRQEEEARRLEAERRRRELLGSVLDSLNSATNETTNLEAENEDIEQTEEELDIAE